MVSFLAANIRSAVPCLDRKKNIRSFKRKEFETYFKRNYTPANTVVCIAGSFNEKKVLRKIKKEFSHPQTWQFAGIQRVRLESAGTARRHKRKADRPDPDDDRSTGVPIFA